MRSELPSEIHIGSKIYTIQATTAAILVVGASAGTIEEMTRDGWHSFSEIVDERAAITATADLLGAGGVYVNVTKTGGGFVVWTKPLSGSGE